MYITISSIKKSLGKYIEMNDLYIGLPILFLFRKNIASSCTTEAATENQELLEELPLF